jgi:signal transduction histidine kinase
MTMPSQRTHPPSRLGAGDLPVVGSDRRDVRGWVRGPRRTAGWADSRRGVRMRLTAIYGVLFLVGGAALLTITYLLVEGAPFAPPAGYNPPAVSGNGPIGAAAARHIVLHTLLLRSGIALAIMAVVSVGLGWLVAGRVLAPLRVITLRTRQISEANLHERLALPGPADEVTELSDTIDGLLARLEEAFLAQRRFVANVSHELRTPLTMMRTSLDVAASKPQPMSPDAAVLEVKVREGLDQADRLVESFLVLARAEAGGTTDGESVSLAATIRPALQHSVAAIEARGLAVHVELQDALVPGSPALLARLVANLLDNAVKYNRPGGAITITTQSTGTMARLTVENDGQQIAPAEAGRLVEPFSRGGVARTRSEDGVGMGLAIVAAITTAHHGTLQLRARPRGGLIAIVELPRADPPARSGAET